jgi:hypothetical protein
VPLTLAARRKLLILIVRIFSDIVTSGNTYFQIKFYVMAERIGKCAPLGKEPIVWHMVYTEAEAIEQGIEYVPWREVEQDQWALTDDGYVAQCLHCKVYTNKKSRTRKMIRFVFGKVIPGNSPLMFTFFKEKGDYNRIKPKGDLENGSLKAKYRNFAFMYAQMMVYKGYVNWKMLGKAFNPMALDPKTNAKRLAKVPKMAKMIQDEIKKALLDNDITPDSVIKMVLEASDTAKSKKDPANMLKAADMLMDVLQMKMKKNAKALPEHEIEAVDALFEVLNDRRTAIESGSDTGDAALLLSGVRESSDTADVFSAERSVSPRVESDPIRAEL